VAGEQGSRAECQKEHCGLGFVLRGERVRRAEGFIKTEWGSREPLSRVYSSADFLPGGSSLLTCSLLILRQLLNFSEEMIGPEPVELPCLTGCDDWLRPV
jgi:hypothetical protein